jgi:hypothetical protein
MPFLSSVWGTMPQSRDAVPLRETAQPANISNPLQYRPNTSVATDDVSESKEAAMLWTIAVILLVLWALGMVTSYTAGGVVHLLLVIAVIVIVVQFIGGRRSI